MALALSTDYIQPAYLTGYVRDGLAVYAANQFTLAAYLPNRTVDDINYRAASGGTGLADAGSFRAYDAESTIVRRQAINRILGELPPISLKMRMSEYDQLRLRANPESAIFDQILNDGMTLARDTEARVEVARGQLLATGKVPIPELGGTVVDFGRAPAHTTTAATLWSNPAADILSDLMTWRDVYLATNGVDPGGLLVSRQVWNLMLRNQSVRNQIFPGASQPSITTTASLNSMLESEGLPPVQLYQAQVNVRSTTTGALTPTRVIPQGVLIYTPAPVAPNAWQDAQLGATLWGPTLESTSSDYGIEAPENPGIVVGNYMDNDPMGMWTKSAAITLPVAANPNLTFAATVV